MRFSERIGKKQTKSILQLEDIDEKLRNSLWNCIQICYWDKKFNNQFFYHLHSTDKIFLKKIWIHFFNLKLDEFPEGHLSEINGMIKKFFFECEWFEVYDYIEFLVNTYDDSKLNKAFMDWCNSVLEEELSAYRFVNFKITQITSKEEIKSIENAINNDSLDTPIKVHFEQALNLLANRENPDYRNSIKESISAVESYFSLYLKDNKVTLGQALKKIDFIHPTILKGISNIYGYTSSADGIRHGLLEEANIKNEDAIFMLIFCSAFVNYSIQKTLNK